MIVKDMSSLADKPFTITGEASRYEHGMTPGQIEAMLAARR